jgi:type IV pilus assembly protein PilY1
MLNHDDAGGGSCTGPQSGANQCTNGGFIPFGFQSLQENDANGAKAAFHSKLSSMPLPHGNQSHKYQASELFFEFFRYLTGGGVFNGHNGWESFDGSIGDEDENIDEEYPDFSWDDAIEASDQYVSPLQAASACAKIFTVNFMFGTLNDDSDSDDEISASAREGGMGGIELGNSNNARFESVLAWLNDSDLADGSFGSAPTLEGTQNVTSYFLVPSANNTENGFARAGGTPMAIELSDDPDELVETLQGIFDDILSVSTTFVSASVPVNVFNRSEVLDNVYVALFQPMETAVWPGNVKKLKLAVSDTETIYLTDANDSAAIASDGRIKYDALTFWTNASELPYPDDNISGSEADSLVDGKDGRFVPRGGSGQMIAGIAGSGASAPGLSNTGTARPLFTENASGTALMALNADGSTAADLETALGADSPEEAECLLRYVRGYDVVFDADAVECNYVDDTKPVRTWLMGDALHSRPLPINYGGTATDPDIRIIFGSNDGFLRMIRNTSNSNTESGEEVWAFMPRAVMSIVKQLYANGPAAQHPYGVDGSVSAYMHDQDRDGIIESGDGDKVWIFFGLRRGGKAYYALDVTNPDSPSLLWSINDADSDFSELGFTFSQPMVGQLKWGTDATPAVIFAGGYDTNKDLRTGTGTDDAEGNALFVVDAETGVLKWKAVKTGVNSSGVHVQASLNDSIPSRVTLLDSDEDGLTDRAYVGDTGGVLWRADFPYDHELAEEGTTDQRSAWTMTPVLSVGRHAGSADRRFFHPPDVAFTEGADADGNISKFDAVLIGSGDRANPLDRTVTNEFYMFKDHQIQAAQPEYDLVTRDELADLTDNCLQELDNECAAEVDLSNGWRIELEDAGEKNLSMPLTLAGTVFFTTYKPPASSGTQCGPAEGSGKLYAMRLQDAKATRNQNTSTDGDGGGSLQKEDRTEDLASGGIPSQVVVIPLGDIQVSGVPLLRPDLRASFVDTNLLWRSFWYQEQN